MGIVVNARSVQNTDPSYKDGVHSKGIKSLVKLSLGCPKKPPKRHSSGFLVDAGAQPVVEKPSPWFPLASSCSRTPDEALDRRIKASKTQSLHSSELGFLSSSSLVKKARRRVGGANFGFRYMGEASPDPKC
ncbi:hypothetical protein Taro_055307 [Colocasia esculenta]|uniref:Uncharacterized protein n=1 Tax=Colocasia esculenta TaxID=4460 RepID=A0A843XTV2_COLES|nr:hypothetical protein [Colocasia esculenta]